MGRSARRAPVRHAGRMAGGAGSPPGFHAAPGQPLWHRRALRAPAPVVLAASTARPDRSRDGTRRSPALARRDEHAGDQADSATRLRGCHRGTDLGEGRPVERVDPQPRQRGELGGVARRSELEGGVCYVGNRVVHQLVNLGRPEGIEVDSGSVGRVKGRHPSCMHGVLRSATSGAERPGSARSRAAAPPTSPARASFAGGLGASVFNRPSRYRMFAIRGSSQRPARAAARSSRRSAGRRLW